jgi:hypothetical protein
LALKFYFASAILFLLFLVSLTKKSEQRVSDKRSREHNTPIAGRTEQRALATVLTKALDALPDRFTFGG